MSRGTESLCEPISAQAPCGVTLEDSPIIANLDSFRVFGRISPPTEREPPHDWNDIKRRAVEALAQSKDLRILAYLAAAVIRTDGMQAFVDTLSAAAQWLETLWDTVYPRIDEDALLRRSALNCFADRLAVIDPLRRSALISHPQLGTVSVRDVDIAAGQVTAGENERPSDATQIKTVFDRSPIESVTAALARIADALSAVRRIEVAMVEHVGVEWSPDLEPLTAYLNRAHTIIRDQLKKHPDAATAGVAASAGNGEDKSGLVEHAAAPIGSIQSREDAVRALDAIAVFFRRSEPSSPIPLILERAKRLVSKDFLEILADVAPDALAQAKAAGGIRD